MRASPPVFLVALGLAACAGAGPASPPAPAAPAPERVGAALEVARTAAGALGAELISALTAAMADGGPGAAIAVCSEQAPQIASRLNTTGVYSIGRTALRVRNPANAADDWEKEQLSRFAAAIASGDSPATMETHVLEETPQGWRVRWMKPIVLQPMCATCHGASIDSGLHELIDALYPQDQATGFAPGELRGAFTAVVNLP